MNYLRFLEMHINCQVLTWGPFLLVLMDDHREDEAIAELSRAIGFKPDLQLLHLRAAFHDSMGDYISTVRDCEAALCLDPSHAETLELCNKARERINEQKVRESKTNDQVFSECSLW